MEKTSIPTRTKTTERNGAAITAGGATSATWCIAAPYRYAEVGNSQSPAALVTVTKGQRVWPRSVNDAGSVWGARFVDRHYKKGDGEDAFRGSVLPAPSERPRNIGRGRGLRRREQDIVASAAGPGQDWSQTELGWTRHQGARLAGVGPVPAPRFLLTGERLPLRRPHSSPPPLRPGSLMERKTGDKASAARKSTPAAKPNEAAPLAPTDATWVYGKSWPPEKPGPGSPPTSKAASFQPGRSAHPPESSLVHAAPLDTNTASGMPGAQRPTPQSSDLHKPLGVGFLNSTHPTAAAETSKGGEGLSSACPVMSAANVAEDLKAKVNLAVSQSVTGDMHWKCFWWVYQDTKGNVQGPFSAARMNEWFMAGFLSMDLQLKRVCDGSFNALGTLIKTWKGVPFAAGVCVAMPPQP